MISELETTDFRKAIGERMKRAREARGLSQIDIAEAADVTRAAVSLWERGESGIDQARLQSVAERLRVDIVWLQYGRGKEPDLKINKGTRRAMRLANTADLGWSDDPNEPPFENGVAELNDQIGVGGLFKGDQSVRDWWRIPDHVLADCGVKKKSKLRILYVATDTVIDVPKGAYVIIDTGQRKVEDGMVYAIDIGTSMTLKRAIEQIGSPKKIGLTDASGAMQIIDRAKLKVEGRVIARFGLM